MDSDGCARIRSRGDCGNSLMEPPKKPSRRALAYFYRSFDYDWPSLSVVTEGLSFIDAAYCESRLGTTLDQKMTGVRDISFVPMNPWIDHDRQVGGGSDGDIDDYLRDIEFAVIALDGVIYE